MSPEFIPAVKAVVIRDDGRVLLLKRAADETHLQEMWDVPGGSIDPGETPREAVQRETDEEAGIAVDIHGPVNTWSYRHDDGAHRVGTTFRCTPASTGVTTGDEHTDHRWASPDGVRSLDMYDDLRTTVLDVMQEHGDFPKLVRDRIPQRIEDDGGTPVVEQVSDGELQDALADKLVEEAREFREDRDPDELADVLEVLRECLAVEDISWRDLEQLRQAKREERGGFDDGVVLERVEAARSDDTDS